MESCGGRFGTREVGQCTDKQLMRAMTNSMDTVIGSLLKSVDALDPNTYVIYIGDNGTWMFGNGREFIDNLYITRQGRGKGTTYESGTKVDLVFRGPRIKGGSASDAVTTGSDLFPTILKLAGLDVPASVPDREGKARIALDGVSLTPALFDGVQQVRNADTGYILSETINPLQGNARQAGVRNGRYKLVCDKDTEAANCRFFDLKNDPLEEYALAKPAACANYVNGQWKPAAPEWHFCRLQEVLAQKSFLAVKR
jgi:arylsulfatase A-like enzyme